MNRSHPLLPGARRIGALLLAVGIAFGLMLFSPSSDGPSFGMFALGGAPARANPLLGQPPGGRSLGPPDTDFTTLINAGSFELAPVRILGVPVIQVTSRTVGAGSEAIDARRRARVIEGNLNLLYQPVQLCGFGEQLADGLIRQGIPEATGDLCSLRGWNLSDPQALSLRTRSLDSGLVLIEAELPGRTGAFPLLTVTWADAQFFGTNPQQLAETWRKNLQARLRNARSMMQPSALLRRVGFSLATILAVVAVEAGLIWLWRRLRRRTAWLHQQARDSPCTSSLLMVQVNFGITRFLLVLVLVGIAVIISLAVMAVPGQIPLGLELLVVPVEAAVKFALVGLLALVLRSVDSFLLYQWSVNLAVAREEQCRRDQRFRSLLKSSHRLINLGCILLVAIWILMGIPGVRTLSSEVFLVGGALLGALALAFQGLLRDFVAGIVVALEDHYAIEDWVEIDGDQGVVVDVGILNTSVRCLDQRVVVVSNSSFQRVVNHTKLRSGLEVTLVIAPNDAPLAQVLALAREELQAFAADPEWRSRMLWPPVLRGVTEVTPLGITISALIVTPTSEQWAAQRELLRRWVERFQTEGVRLAYVPELRSLAQR